MAINLWNTTRTAPVAAGTRDECILRGMRVQLERAEAALDYALAMLEAALETLDSGDEISDIMLAFGIQRVKDLRDGITPEMRKFELYKALHGEETARRIIEAEKALEES